MIESNGFLFLPIMIIVKKSCKTKRGACLKNDLDCEFLRLKEEFVIREAQQYVRQGDVQGALLWVKEQAGELEVSGAAGCKAECFRLGRF